MKALIVSFVAHVNGVHVPVITVAVKNYISVSQVLLSQSNPEIAELSRHLAHEFLENQGKNLIKKGVQHDSYAQKNES